MPRRRLVTKAEPDTSALLIDPRALDALVAAARLAPRKRLNRNLHRSFEDPIQRLLNAGEPGSYVRPHRHATGRWELFAALRGRIDVLLFADDGRVTERLALDLPGGIIEIPGGTLHSIVFVDSGSVALEVKPGPYNAASDKEFAAWAPPEDGSAAALAYAQWLAAVQPGAPGPAMTLRPQRILSDINKGKCDGG